MTGAAGTDGQRAAATKRDRSGRQRPPETCRTCGRLRPAKVRDAAGRPQCSACRRRDPATWQQCAGCDRDRPVNARTPDGRALCVSCYQPPTTPCDGCGTVTAVASRTGGRRLCARCHAHPMRPCGQCGRTRRVAVTARDGQPDLCPTCHQAPTLVCAQCGQTGPCRTTTPDRSPICWRCQLHRQLEQTLGAHVPPPLRPLLQALRDVEQPRSVLGWLARSPAAPVLAAMATGQAPVHHQTLDTAGADRGGRAFAIEHLRQLLVASGALPDRDEHLHRLQQRLATVIDAGHPDDQAVLRAYATWQLLRRLRDRANAGAPTLHAADRAHEVLAEAARFLGALREHDLTLGSCTQASLDQWLTSRRSAQRLLPVFLTWAQRQYHLPGALTITAAPGWQLGSVQPADQRWQLARQLLHDDALPTPDRVAGLLVLLYGQTLSRISRLRPADVTTGPDDVDVRLQLGTDAIQIGEPLATLLRRLPIAASVSTARGLPAAEQWLFPGRRPGRAAHPTTLAKRLRRLAVEPRAGRNSALLHLAEHLPARVLADLLGLHIGTAERWSTTAGTRWMGYAGNH